MLDRMPFTLLPCKGLIFCLCLHQHQNPFSKLFCQFLRCHRCILQHVMQICCSNHMFILCHSWNQQRYFHRMIDIRHITTFTQHTCMSLFCKFCRFLYHNIPLRQFRLFEPILTYTNSISHSKHFDKCKKKFTCKSWIFLLC